ncbi:hypothetical protein ZTR_09407 [Talaromyces verruculosus]|nr:hypothetical protein ZTR_09407 [Talaromyces verruculosus]
MIEVQHGELSIDGVNLKTYPRGIIRNKVTVIPQDPVLFSGRSVRENLAGVIAAGSTLAGNHDLRILETLEKVQLREYVESCTGGLDARIDGLFLSTGRQQLICLARAIIMKQKIVLVDEATSNVDEKSAELMQSVIRTEFSDCTIIAVAPRLNSLLDFDMIDVIDEGRIVEYDSPGKLLSRSQSLFRQLYEMQQGTTRAGL